ncbi:hypothetical protein [Thalassotalea litorea]|uniref:hypothetical protein n=1 Tax=Thalassotalea litorea TaxID=2020715 RepID=UPI0037362BFF
MNLKKLLQQEKQHVLISPKSYFLLILLSFTAVFSCIFELTLTFHQAATFPYLEIAFICGLAATILVFALLIQAKTDLLDAEIVEQEQ